MEVVVADADTAAGTVFRNQTGHLDPVHYMDIGQGAIVTIQEDAHRAAAVIDNKRIGAGLAHDGAGYDGQPALVFFQRSLCGCQR